MHLLNFRHFTISCKCKSYKSVSIFPFIKQRYNSTQPVALEFSSHFPTNQMPTSNIPIVILHGLMGSRLNWRTLANVIALKFQKQVYTLDARNHGDSPHSDNFDYHSMTADIVHFLHKQDIQQAVLLGHSMGGRTAMTVALEHADLVERLIVVDVSPADMPREDSHNLQSFALAMRENLKQPLPTNITLTEARQIMNIRLAEAIPILSIRQFILMNLVPADGGFKWKCNVDIIADKFASIIHFPSMNGAYTGETLFICGEKSAYVSKHDHEYIKSLFPKAQFIYIPGAGHWVHSEKPQEFLSALGEVFGND